MDQMKSLDRIGLIIRKEDLSTEYIKNHPEIYPTVHLNSNFTIGFVEEKNVDTVTRDLGQAFLCSESTVLGLLDHGSYHATEARPNELPVQNKYALKGEGVLIGFVDTGIDYTSQSFRYYDGTSKIASIYDQTIQGHAPYGISIGTEYSRQQINNALESLDPYTIVPSRDTVGHGTFLASVAAGNQNGDLIGASPDAELIVVKLRTASSYYREKYLIPEEQDHVYTSCDFMLGIDYIIKKSRELNRPVIICLSLGTNFGGHDGYSFLEQYLSSVSKLPGICICTPAGNERLSKHHYFGALSSQEGFQTVSLRIPEEHQDVFLTLWNHVPDILSVSIKSPKGELIEHIVPKTDTWHESHLSFGNSVVRIEYNFPVEGSGGQNINIKILNAIVGVWEVIIHADYVIDGRYHIWLPIRELVSPEVHFENPEQRFTIVIPGTCKNLITCGAYNTTNHSLYPLSSWGPTALPSLSPDLVAPGVDIGGIYPNGQGTLSGTSVATAVTAGACAILMQWGILYQGNLLNTSQIRSYLIQGASRLAGQSYPNFQTGYGKLDISEAIRLAEL